MMSPLDFSRIVFNGQGCQMSDDKNKPSDFRLSEFMAVAQRAGGNSQKSQVNSLKTAVSDGRGSSEIAPGSVINQVQPLRSALFNSDGPEP